MDTIQLENMEFYAFHGCYEQERIIGTRFLVDLQISADLSKAADTDNINDTINYQAVFQVVREQMEIPSDLLENVAKRIVDSLYLSFSAIKRIRVKVSKMDPPLGGQIERVSVTFDL